MGANWKHDPQRQEKLDAAYRQEWSNLFSGIGHGIKDFASDPFSSISQGIEQGWESVKDTASEIGDAISEGWDNVKDTASDVWGGIKDTFGFGDDKKDSTPTSNNKQKHEGGENNGAMSERDQEAMDSAADHEPSGYEGSAP